MRPGREIDARVAQEIFGFEVFAKNKVLHENADKGVRPLRHYSKDMGLAWEVAEKMRVSIIPVENNNWFAFVGPKEGWTAPEAFLEYLRSGDFSMAGAAVHENAAQAICEAALVANQKRKGLPQTTETSVITSNEDNETPTSLH